MITVYESRETNFKHNGLGVLRPSSCLIYEELNGEYSLTLKHPIDNYEKWKLLEQDRIIKANGQLFRIYKLTHSIMDNEVEVFAMHIFYDLSKNFIRDINIVDKTGKQALNHILDNTLYENNFTCDSDITKINSARLVRKNVTSVLIGDDENSFLKYWGGELKRDNFNFQINTVIGENKGMKISYGKNLTGLTAMFDMSNIATRIVPVAFDGITLPEVYVDSDYVNNYAQPIVREVKFSDVKFASSPNNTSGEGFATKEEVYTELRRLSRLMFTSDKIDVPEINFNVDFVELSKTEQYKKYSNLETVGLGDVVNIHHKVLGINIDARVISYEFNCLTNRYDSIELGSFQTNIFTGISELIKREDINMQTITDLVNVSYENAVNEATLLITNGLGGYVVKTRDELLIMDSDDINTAKNVWRWNINGLGFSSTGYNGTYGLAMTHDGQIVADRITAGELNGEVIRANSITTNHLQVETVRKIENSQSEEEVRTLIETALGSFEVTITDKYEAKIDDELNSLSNDYYTKVETESKIQQNATQIATTVAREEVQNMQIGGTNLIGQTSEIRGYGAEVVEVTETGWTVRGSNTDRDNAVFRFINALDGNGWYTFSFDGKFGGSSFRTYVEANDQRVGTVDLSSEWQHFSFTFEVTNYDFDNTGLYTFIEFQCLGNELYYFKNVQLEHGKIETDYSPCPRDYSTTTQMNSVIQQKADSITSTVSAYRTGVANLLLNSSEGKGLNNPSSGYHQISYNLCGDLNGIYFHENRYFCLSFTVGYTGSFNSAPFDSISFQNNWKTRWYASDIQKIERVGDNAYRYYMKPLKCARTFVSSDKLTFIGERGNGNGWFCNVMLTEGELHPSAYTPSNHDYSNKFSEIKQTTDSITSTVSSNYTTLNNKFNDYSTTTQMNSAIKQQADSITSTVSSNYNALNNKFNNYPTTTQMNSAITQKADSITSSVSETYATKSTTNGLSSRLSTAESTISQHTNQIATKVDVNGVKSTIQQNPESVRIGFNGISDYFDLNSTRLKVGHSDGSYTRIGQDGILYYPGNGSANRYYCLMKQGWTETITMSNYGANGWSTTIKLPDEFKGKVFSVIPCLTYVLCPNLADAIKGFEINIPQENVDYNKGTFKIFLYASGLWAERLTIHYDVQIRMTWIAIA